MAALYAGKKMDFNLFPLRQPNCVRGEAGKNFA